MDAPPERAQTARPIVLALLLLHLALGVWQMTHTSPTFDEGFYIARGWAWWRTGELMVLGHPPLASQLAGLGPLLEPDLPHPREIAGWERQLADTFSNALLWEVAPNPDRLVYLARLPFLLLSLLLGALTYTWATQRFGVAGGVLALALHALSPNLLGNAPLAATDLPVTVFFVFTLFAYDRALTKPTLGRAALAGVLLGLLQGSKFSALLIGPVLAALTLWQLRHTLWPTVRTATVTVLIGVLTLWAVDGFTLIPYPLANYLTDLQHFLALAEGGHFAYLLGQLSEAGWWYYHPLVLAVKTPLALWALLLLSAGLTLRAREFRRTDGVLLGTIGFFLGLSMLTSLNVGYRYLLPILPLLHIGAAGAVRWKPAVRPVVLTGVLASALALLPVAPDFLTYFNLAAGGPANGWRIVVDSNLDWGQGLPAVAEAEGDRPIYLSYFGQADPAHYGIFSTALPGWPPPQTEPDFQPAFPASGRYVISASNLVGVQLNDPNAFGFFRHRPPDEVIDYSYFVYDVPERPLGGWFNQCGPARLLTSRDIFDLTGFVGPLRVLFDCSAALVTGPGPGWVLLPDEATAPVPLPTPDYIWQRADGTPFYRISYLPAGWTPDLPPVPETTFGAALTLSAVQVTPLDDTIEVIAAWRVVGQVPPPVSLFAHLIAFDGSFQSAGDALAVQPDGWQVGGWLVQRHVIALPPGLAPGEYRIFMGLYRLDTNERYLTEAGTDSAQISSLFLPAD